MADQQTPPGWYPTPDGTQRYWDGTKWTESVAPSAPTGAPPAPTKRGGALKWVLLAVGLVLVLGFGSCIAIVATAGNEVSKALDSVSTDLGTSAPDSTPGTSDGSGDQDNPVVINEGKAFDVREFAYAKGWKIDNSDFGLSIKNLKVTNNRADKDAALVDIKFWKGTEVLATVSCTSDQIFTGTTVTLTCFSGDSLPKGYDKITINDTF